MRGREYGVCSPKTKWPLAALCEPPGAAHVKGSSLRRPALPTARAARAIVFGKQDRPLSVAPATPRRQTWKRCRDLCQEPGTFPVTTHIGCLRPHLGPSRDGGIGPHHLVRSRQTTVGSRIFNSALLAPRVGAGVRSGVDFGDTVQSRGSEIRDDPGYAS